LSRRYSRAEDVVDKDNQLGLGFDWGVLEVLVAQAIKSRSTGSPSPG